MSFKLTHAFHDHLELAYQNRMLFRYVYNNQTPEKESPRPYFYPLCTLAGDNVALFRPHDHRWHHGLSMTVAHLNGQNFWGGATYVRDQGYVQQPNNGRQQHLGWEDLTVTDQRVTLVERLAWITQAGDKWIDEQRRIHVAEINHAEGYWTLEIGFLLRNISGETLEFGSPATEGRPGVGYGGLFWRGVRDFTGGQIIIANGASTTSDDMAVMGQRGGWLAFIGQHDGQSRSSTLLFVDHPDNPRHPTRWYARTESMVCASFAFMFDEVYSLAPGDDLALNYRIVLANGAWSREKIAAFAG